MKSKIFILLFIGLALLSFASASSHSNSELIFKQNDIVNYSFTCIDTNNSYCNGGTICNININDPQGGRPVNNGTMSPTATSFAFILPTNDIGIYNWLIICDGTSNAISEGTYVINSTGTKFDNLWMNFLIVFLLSSGSISIAVYAGARQRFEDNQLFYYLASFFLFAIGVFVIINGFAGYKNQISQAFGFVNWGLALYFLTKPWFTGKKWFW